MAVERVIEVEVPTDANYRERKFWERVYIEVAGGLAKATEGQQGRDKATRAARKWADLALLAWRETWQTGTAVLETSTGPKSEPKFGFGDATPEPQEMAVSSPDLPRKAGGLYPRRISQEKPAVYTREEFERDQMGQTGKDNADVPV